jgi:mono/diheme cytochrome c family protein
MPINQQHIAMDFVSTPRSLSFAAVVLLLGMTLDPSALRAQAADQNRLIDSTQGPTLYREHCAVCHGTGGHGDGPMASRLKAKVPDLTRLAAANNGQFPAARVRKTIEGTDAPTSHGTRVMPIWGPVFHQVEGDKDFGYVRIDNLVRYLETIQR